MSSALQLKKVTLGVAIGIVVGLGIFSVRSRADADRVSRARAAFTEWAEKNGVKDGALAILEGGKVTGRVGVGRTTPSDPEPIASESKSITAICMLKLVEAGKLRFEDALGKLLPEYFAAHPPLDPRAQAITIAALLTHTSGLGADVTQGAGLLDFRPFSEPAPARLLAAALAVPMRDSSYAYNNVNYAALGLVIERVSGDPYETHCERTVLRPVGIRDASIIPAWKVLGAFGGWKLSAEDEAKFLAYFDPTANLLKTKPDAWPRASLGGGAFYSLGTLMRSAGAGYNFWHFGAWVWKSEPAASFGAYFVRWTNGYGVAANYQPAVNEQAERELDRSMWQAVQ